MIGLCLHLTRSVGDKDTRPRVPYSNSATKQQKTTYCCNTNRPSISCVRSRALIAQLWAFSLLTSYTAPDRARTSTQASLRTAILVCRQAKRARVASGDFGVPEEIALVGGRKSTLLRWRRLGSPLYRRRRRFLSIEISQHRGRSRSATSLFDAALCSAHGVDSIVLVPSSSL